MKIGILTFHDTNNFGSYLQTYGLYKAIKDLHYDCEIIDYQCPSIIRREIPKSFTFEKNPILFIKNSIAGLFLKKKYKNLKSFLTNEMTLSKRYTKNNIKECQQDYDKIIVGSDIVWGLDITEGDTTYFLDFFKQNNTCKKYAFSSSIGNPWSAEEKSLVKPLLCDFNGIAVREEESAQWVEELIGIRPDVVCDPTMLIPPAKWKEYVSNKYSNKKYTLVYFPTEKGLEAAKEYARLNKLEIFVVGFGKPSSPYTYIHPYSISDFLSLIYHAQYVFTGSYHGMLFSIYFNKEFSFFNRAHKSRMATVARRLQVENRENYIGSSPIDYKKVNEKLDEYRSCSLSVLNKMLQS